MSTKLPYVVQPTIIKKVLDKVRDAKTPDRFTIDFLQTKLGCRGGNYRQFIPLAKKLGLLNSDGTPTGLYKSFRNPSTTKASVAEGIRTGYRELFDRNEYAGSLSKEELKGLVVEATGLDTKDAVVALICRTFEALRALADFDQKLSRARSTESNEDSRGEVEIPRVGAAGASGGSGMEAVPGLDLRLSYTINLVLPKTDDPAVFDAIFRTLRDQLLRK
jgi:hypothetical protein